MSLTRKIGHQNGLHKTVETLNPATNILLIKVPRIFSYCFVSDVNKGSGFTRLTILPSLDIVIVSVIFVSYI